MVYCVTAIVVVIGIVGKPWKIPDYVWALGGASVCLIAHSISPAGALAAVVESCDVVAFLIGMMLLSALAADVGIFDMVADRAIVWSRGNATALYWIVYAGGVATTMFLSNDATAVVLTPAVILTAKRAKVDPVPLVLACAFVSNAASTLLPVSNPANLVLYHAHPPPLFAWIGMFFWPSLAAIGVSGGLLCILQAQRLQTSVTIPEKRIALSPVMTRGFIGLGIVIVVLSVASQAGYSLGFITLALSVILVSALSAHEHARVRRCTREISFGVLLLVPALFIVTEAANHLGVIAAIRTALITQTTLHGYLANTAFTALITVASAFANNLPVGLGIAEILQSGTPAIFGIPLDAAHRVAVLAVDIGPNIATTASLATILWLEALRKESIAFSPLAFLRLGLCIAPLSLLAALAVLR